jgi:cytidylate kinase
MDGAVDVQFEEVHRAAVEAEVLNALGRYDAVSVEISGYSESDFVIIRSAQVLGHRVVRVWISATREERLARIRRRDAGDMIAAVSTDLRERLEVIRSWGADAPKREPWDATIDNSGPPDANGVAASLRVLLND